ncbi:MAG: glycosyltransferase, partial [Paludibacteraceae bacterium]|nr:glycosyltransferase [Paludibacteraceae bacterium]
MKTVSVIVPAYNVAADLLQRCLRSLKEQTYPDLQIILADDGSDTPVPGAIRMPHRGLAATR